MKQKLTAGKFLILASSFAAAVAFIANEVVFANNHPEAVNSVSSKTLTSPGLIPNLFSPLFYLVMLVLFAHALGRMRKNPWRVTVLRLCFAVVIGAVPFLLNFMANTSFYDTVVAASGNNDIIAAVGVLSLVLFFWALLGYAIHRAIRHYKNQTPPSEPSAEK